MSGGGESDGPAATYAVHFCRLTTVWDISAYFAAGKGKKGQARDAFLGLFDSSNERMHVGGYVMSVSHTASVHVPDFCTFHFPINIACRLYRIFMYVAGGGERILVCIFQDCHDIPSDGRYIFAS